METIIRYAITHVNDLDSLRRITFALQAQNLCDTQEEAQAQLEYFLGPEGLVRVLSKSEMSTLRVDPVLCYTHGDPIQYYVNNDKNNGEREHTQ